MYDTGEGVPQDYQTALKWYSLAAEQGHVDAQTSLGSMYDTGEGVPQGYKTAMEGRKIVEKRMTPADISAAEKLARECAAKNYKEC